jgi:hypothetical protein
VQVVLGVEEQGGSGERVEVAVAVKAVRGRGIYGRVSRREFQFARSLSTADAKEACLNEKGDGGRDKWN